ncbi:hypothetical protein HanRHA438_Chr02g0056591 [Helianthus annuus]|nr:hypothetical protein HanHA300_Chr02g0045171 [Helianthus annuus]KAJ0607945.1 hypothetical protein HanHA89_Chr03g0103101 [Helianthus annuus]KAJ0618051.1 hypothetical protein HanHA89_Chr02g0048801 [Helianthus annuus]KAJ0917008.1 hypothetical protein HanPSC8_Chr06g0268401 [Helianthus annuus]KAJ0939042.1 hypothetical protein HanRHA438_Chr02g0056591 [Helianthus annuus]
MWFSVTGVIGRPPVPVMCVFMLLTAHGVTFLNTANVVTAVVNFTNHSGTIVGIMKLSAFLLKASKNVAEY